MLANREGIFLATIGDKSVAPNGPNKLATFMANYHLIEELGPEGATDVSNEGMTITGYHYLEKKDGSLNESTIQKLREATGWDGRDPFWLEYSLPGDLVVKLTLGFDVYNGKQSLKVNWIDHRDSTGFGVVKASEAEKTAIRNKLASKLRAIAGGTPAKTAPAPASAPTMPVKTPEAATAAAPAASPAPVAAPPAKRGRPKSAPAAPVAPVAAPAAPPACTQEEAWDAFVKAAPGNATEENVASQWTKILNDLFPTKGDEDMTPEDWAKMRDDGPAQFVPF